MLLEIISATLLISVLSVCVYYATAFSYWKKRNVPFVKPKFPFGNTANPLFAKQHLYFDIYDVYKKLKQGGFSYGGFYMLANPFLLVVDPELAKNITTRDFQAFTSRFEHKHNYENPIENHLFVLTDPKWKNLRSKLTPTFTSGKIKHMFSTLKECTKPLLSEIEKKMSANQDLDVKELVSSFTIDVISSCAFGIECNSFQNPDAPLRKFGRTVMKLDLKARFKRLLISSYPTLARLLGLHKFTPEENDFFLNIAKDTVEYRERNSIRRPDFLQLLIDMKNGKEMLSMDEIAAQCFVFYLGGFETSASVLTYCTYELAKNQDVQNRLRAEVKEVLEKYGGEISYEAIAEMAYLDQVIRETLRKYPPLPLLNRVCTVNYPLPNSNVVLEKGTNILISNYALQHDPEYFPEPEMFDPDRFSKENKDKIVPYTYMPFGEGPRNCIGLRFGLIQAKTGLAAMINEYKIHPSANTLEKLTFDVRSLTLSTTDIIYLNFQKINE